MTIFVYTLGALTAAGLGVAAVWNHSVNEAAAWFALALYAFADAIGEVRRGVSP